MKILNPFENSHGWSSIVYENYKFIKENIWLPPHIEYCFWLGVSLGNKTEKVE